MNGRTRRSGGADPRLSFPPLSYVGDRGNHRRLLISAFFHYAFLIFATANLVAALVFGEDWFIGVSVVVWLVTLVIVYADHEDCDYCERRKR